MEKLTIMEQFKKADEGGYAVPHFNFSDIWDLEAIVRAAEEMRSPVIVASNMKCASIHRPSVIAGMEKAIAARASVPVYLHLDHSTTVDLCKEAVDAGYDTVMIDGSKLSLEENIACTKAVADYAHKTGRTFVEGEIGKIKGNTEEAQYKDGDFLVQVPDAVELVSKSGVDFLAVGIGTAHGFYQGKPEINFDRLAEVNAALDLPLVLHGGTGIPEEDVRKAIANGINKVNVGTIIYHTNVVTIFKTIQEHDTNMHTLDLMPESQKAIMEVVKGWIKVCMSDGKA